MRERNEQADPSGFVELVLAVVESIPVGSVMSYGDVADYVGSHAPRQVGQVMARYGASVPWHRVLRSDGTPAPSVAHRQLALLAAEGVPIANGRVAMREARVRGPLLPGDGAPPQDRAAQRWPQN